MLDDRTALPSHNETFAPTPLRACLLALVAGAVLLAGSISALAGATQIGVSNDEPNHQSRMNVWFDTGWYLPERFLDGNRPADDITEGRLHAYGASYSIVAHAFATTVGAEQWGTTERTAQAYTSRGIVVALLGIVAALAVGYALAVATSSRLVGLWSAAAVMALPLWTGYSMFAVKDVPAGAGWTCVTAALMVALFRSYGWRRPAAIGLLAATGVWFSVGVRTALWVPIVAMLTVFATLAAARGWSPLRANVAAVAGGLAVGMSAVAVLHYRSAATPVEWLTSAVRTSSDFHWTGATLSAGQLVTEKPPWWYLPAWIGGSLPILLGGLAVGGMLAVLVTVARRSGWRERLTQPSAPMLLWGMQALMLPTAATVGGATMYAGLRQHLYVLPAFAALAGYAAWRLTVSRWGRWSAVAMAAALLLPTVEQAQLHPYQFVYKNAVAGPVDDRWETDMHFVSAREAIRRVPSDVEVWCYKRSIRRISGDLVQPGRTRCSGQSQIRPFLDEQGTSATAAKPADGNILVIGRKYRGSPPPLACTDRDSVTRRLRGEMIVLSYVLTCDSDLYDSSAGQRSP